MACRPFISWCTLYHRPTLHLLGFRHHHLSSDWPTILRLWSWHDFTQCFNGIPTIALLFFEIYQFEFWVSLHCCWKWSSFSTYLIFSILIRKHVPSIQQLITQSIVSRPVDNFTSILSSLNLFLVFSCSSTNLVQAMQKNFMDHAWRETQIRLVQTTSIMVNISVGSWPPLFVLELILFVEPLPRHFQCIINDNNLIS